MSDTKQVVILEDGNFDISSESNLVVAAQRCIQTQMAPPDLASKGVSAVMTALLMCKQHKLPFSAIGQMAYINGRITVHSQLYTALAERHPNFRPQEIFYIDRESKKICMENQNFHQPVYGCVFRIQQIGSSEKYNEYFFTIDDAVAAGLYDEKQKKGTPWYKYTKDMLYHKAKARAYGREYASAIQGLLMTEDLHGTDHLRVRDVNTSEGLKEFKEVEAQDLSLKSKDQDAQTIDF